MKIKRPLQLFLTIALTATMASTALPASKAARYLMKQEITKACDGSGGKFAGGVIETDLTGDNRSDLVLDHGAIQCRNGQRSGFCGAAMCSVIFYARDTKGLLRMKLEMLGIGAKLKGGNPPKVETFHVSGSASLIQWNGKTYE